MARKSIQELIAQATADFPDNVTGLITPEKLRQFCIDFLNAIVPAYALMSNTGTTQTLGPTPSLIVMATVFDSNSAETTTVVPASTITRADRGTSYINVDCDIEAPTNRFVTFRLYKNGAPTGGDVTVNGAGTGNPVTGSFAWMDYADPAATYDLRATCETAGTSVLLSNVSVLLSVEPVNSYA